MTSPYVIGVIILGTVAVLAATAAAGYRAGYNREKAVLESTVAAAATKAAQAQAEQDAISSTAAVRQVQAQQLVEHTFSTIERKVPIYVTKMDRDCHLSVGAVRLWNAAVAGSDTLPGSAGKPDAAASTITAADALNNAVTNAAIYHRTAAELVGLQGWITAQQGVK